MTPDRLQAIKARLEAATQGDWRSTHTGGIMASRYIGIPLTYDDSDLIANAPADLRDLITALEAALERIAILEAKALHDHSAGFVAGFSAAATLREEENQQLNRQLEAVS